MFSDAIILTGPTGSGKSAVAVALAKRIGAEILAMDSMTVYRGMDIGTAKPTAQERAEVPHHLIDELEPHQSANVAWWLARATNVCAEIRARGKRPLFVGGTPLYLKAIRHGLFDAPPADPLIRAKWDAFAEQHGLPELHAQLMAIDAKSAARLHPNDVRRVVRALEVYDLTGKPLSSFQQTWDSPSFANATPTTASIPCIILEWPREELYARIDRRVRAMFDAGWLEEARRLRAQPLSREAGQALGYRELFALLASETPELEATIALVRMRTRQFAKRQLTWFRSLKFCTKVAADSADIIGEIADLGLLPAKIQSK